MVHNRSTPSNWMLLTISIVMASIWWLQTILFADIMDHSQLLYTQQALAYFAVAQLAIISILFAEMPNRRVRDFVLVACCLFILAIGPVPATALSIYVPRRFRAHDRDLYRLWLTPVILGYVFAGICFLFLLQRIAIVSLNAIARMIVDGLHLKPKREEGGSFSLANILMGTILIAIVFSIVVRPTARDEVYDLSKSFATVSAALSLLPLFVTWLLWRIANWMRGSRNLAIFHCGLALLWLLVIYHVAEHTFLFGMPGYPRFFEEADVSIWEHIQAILVFFGLSAIVVQIACLLICLPSAFRWVISRKKLEISPTVQA